MFMFEKKKKTCKKMQYRHEPLGEPFPYIQLLCWKSSNSHPGGISFGYTEHISDVGGRDAQASARPSNGAV